MGTQHKRKVDAVVSTANHKPSTNKKRYDMQKLGKLVMATLREEEQKLHQKYGK